jgi:hypothetical protein
MEEEGDQRHLAQLNPRAEMEGEGMFKDTKNSHICKLLFCLSVDCKNK